MKHVLILISSLFFTSAAFSQPVTEIVVPYGPGGTMSNLAHIAAQALTEQGTPAVVINKPGAQSTIGANYAAMAKPDGHTLLVGAGSNLAANPVFKPEGMRYNENSFSPIVPLGSSGWTLYVQGNGPIKNYEQFKFYVRANPEKFTIAFYNINLAKLFYAWADQEGLPRPIVIPYKGAAPSMIDVINGNVLCGIAELSSTAEMYKGKRIDIIAAFDKDAQRNAVKLSNNAGIVDITRKHPSLNFTAWWGLWAPAGTSPEKIADINSKINNAFNTPQYQEKISKYMLNNVGGSAEDTYAWQQRDLKILRATQIKYQ